MQPSVRRVNRPREAARSSYNRLSRWYDLLSGSIETKLRNRGLERLSPRPGERILEIGFGTGHSLVALAEAVGPAGRVIGMDISEGMLSVAAARVQKKGLADRVSLHRGDAIDLHFLPPASLDGIFMSFTLELFDTPDIPCVLAECHRLLKPGGRLVVVSMSRPEPPGMAVRLYEWLHDRLPSFADCRPILARQAVRQGGFSVKEASLASVWGLPVEIVLAGKP